MDAQRLLELLITGGLAGLIAAVSVAWKNKRDAARDDRQQQSNETTGAATAAKALTDAAASIVKLQDDQVEEFKLQIRALQAESSALNRRLDIEVQKRLRAEAMASTIEDQVNQLREKLAAMGAQFEIADQERASLRHENGAMKTKIFEMSVGLTALTRQIKEAGMTPVYTFDIPVVAERTTGKLGPIDVGAVRQQFSS